MPQQEHENIQGHSSPDSGSVITSFDELTKVLATGPVPRRKALRWMGGALVGAVLASVPGVAWAACPEGQTRCGDRCVNLQTNERHCGSCSNRCRSTQTCCKGRCVNLQRNERHCGSCFNRCAEGQECVGGVCQGGCPPEKTLTAGNCNCAFTCGDQFPSPSTCHEQPDCLCYETTEGSGFCGSAGAPFCDLTCSSSSDCPSGSKCVVNTCCVEPRVCATPCLAVTSSAG